MKLSKTSTDIKEQQAIINVLKNGYLGMGEQVKLFELELAEYLQLAANRVISCVNSGTAALHIALSALDIGPGDEVLVPSITYVACFQAISATGAIPVICDVREDSVFIDIKSAEKLVTSNTKAILAVHYASDCSGLSQVYEFAALHKLRVIEDAAHSFGGVCAGKPIGATGDIVCFSFDGIKNITSGEGGAIVTSDLSLAKRIQDCRLLGVAGDTARRYGEKSISFDVHAQGFRYHMSNIMAAIGRTQLLKINDFSVKRKALVKQYLQELANIEDLEFLPLDYAHIVPHIFVVKIKNDKRDLLKKYLLTKEIECGFHYPLGHKLSLYKTAYQLPVAEKLATELLTLPLHVELDNKDITFITANIKQFLQCSQVRVDPYLGEKVDFLGV